MTVVLPMNAGENPPGDNNHCHLPQNLFQLEQSSLNELETIVFTFVLKISFILTKSTLQQPSPLQTSSISSAKNHSKWATPFNCFSFFNVKAREVEAQVPKIPPFLCMLSDKCNFSKQFSSGEATFSALD
jgi:hypothetical protein